MSDWSVNRSSRTNGRKGLCHLAEKDEAGLQSPWPTRTQARGALRTRDEITSRGDGVSFGQQIVVPLAVEVVALQG
jgi:hypothetical protein